MSRGVKMSEENQELLKQMSRAGYVQDAIAEKLGCSRGTVYMYQKKFGIKASNRWKFGENPMREPLQLKKAPVYEATQNSIVRVVDMSIELAGIKTGFKYHWNVNDNSIIIETGYCTPLEIDLKDFAPFGNEVLDMAEQMQKLLNKLK